MNSIIRLESSKPDITGQSKSPEPKIDRHNIDNESMYYSMSEKKPAESSKNMNIENKANIK